ncbi:MAG: GNAT family N-acetyltransferase [Pseudomonas sp.]|uniref:GNAT family N-acetyltransferase n=1 Tax=Pseudomonas sp. TaxID=306 RepID=UPI0033937399
MDALTPYLAHRPAKTTDLAAVAAFAQTPEELFFCYPTATWPLDADQLQRSMTTRRDSTLALVDERAVGFANLYQWRHGKHCALGNLMVAPGQRGVGVAQYLVGAMEELARTHFQARYLNACCFNANSPALRLYLKLGFQVTGLAEQLDHRQQRVVLVQLQKNLRPGPIAA